MRKVTYLAMAFVAFALFATSCKKDKKENNDSGITLGTWKIGDKVYKEAIAFADEDDGRTLVAALDALSENANGFVMAFNTATLQVGEYKTVSVETTPDADDLQPNEVLVATKAKDGGVNFACVEAGKTVTVKKRDDGRFTVKVPKVSAASGVELGATKTTIEAHILVQPGG